MPKLFNIPAKRTKGQCDAMRCTQTEGLTSGWKHPLEDESVVLCERHAKELRNYIAATNGHNTQTEEESSEEKPLQGTVLTEQETLNEINNSNSKVINGQLLLGKFRKERLKEF